MGATRFRSRRISAEGGFTILELSVTTMLLLVVIGSLMSVFLSIQRTQVFTQERSQTLDDMRIAIDRLTKEARQATTINSGSTASTLDMQTFVNGISKRVIYQVDSSSTKLLRTVGANSATILTNLDSPAIFTYAPGVIGAQVITVSLSVHPARRPNTILQLKSEVRLRNEVTT